MAKLEDDVSGLDLSRPHAPRWVASNRLRKLGFRTSVALKHGDGSYMTRGQATDAVIAINRMIRDFEAGRPVSKSPWAHLAPLSQMAAPASEGPRSIGFLLDSFVGVEEKGKPADQWQRPPHPEFLTRAPRTQADMRQRLRRLLDVLANEPYGPPDAGDMPEEAFAEAMARYTRNIALARAAPFMDLVPPPLDEDEELDQKTPLQLAYATLATMINDRTGQPQLTNARLILSYASVWITWVRKSLRGRWANPVRDVDLAVPEGRIVIWEPYEVTAVCAEARKQGWYSIDFAVRLALELSWSQQDVLDLRWGHLRDGRFKHARGKTDTLTETTLTDDGAALIEEIRTHYTAQAGGNVRFLPSEYIIRVDRRYGRRDAGSVGKPWKQGYFRQVFADIRDVALQGANQSKTFMDLRDTAITVMYEAGLTFAEIASRTQHSLTHIQKVIEKHYGKITRAVSDSAAEKLNERQRKTRPPRV